MTEHYEEDTFEEVMRGVCDSVATNNIVKKQGKFRKINRVLKEEKQPKTLNLLQETMEYYYMV